MINTGLLNQSSTGTGTLPDGLLKTPLSLITSLQAVTDNGGTASPLSLSTTRVGINPIPLTGSLATSALSITQTLNTSGSPDVINLDVTNTASGATTTLLNLRVTGTSVFRVNRLGGITVAGASVFSASTTFASTIDTSGGSNFRIATQPNKTLLINNTYTNVAAPTAILELQSTNQGFLPPKMTNAQRLLIGSGTPAVGLMVYCTDAVEGLYVYKSTGWAFIV